MVTLLERHIRSINQRLMLLAPWQADIPNRFANIEHDVDRHHARLREIQRLRAGIYLRDGAVERGQLSAQGLHRTREDERSWHLAMVDGRQRITACVWYLRHDNTTRLRDLRVHDSSVAHLRSWGDTVRKAVALELARAQHEHLSYAEIGGWAVTPEHRGTSAGVVLALAAYSLGRFFGGALGLTTATVRHSSSSILRRLGGAPLEADGTIVPPYYEARYNCMMELLRFDSQRPSARYAGLIELLRAQLGTVMVVGSGIEASDRAVQAKKQTAAVAPSELAGYVAPLLPAR